MPVEPHNVRFQVGTAILPQDVKTPDQYREAVKAKMGGKIPSFAEMAKLEQQAREKRYRIYSSIPSKPPLPVEIPPDMPKPDKSKKRGFYGRAVADWHCDKAFDAIPPGGAKTNDIARKLNRSHEGVRVTLVRLKAQGRVYSTANNSKRAVVWHRIEKTEEVTP